MRNYRHILPLLAFSTLPLVGQAAPVVDMNSGAYSGYSANGADAGGAYAGGGVNTPTSAQGMLHMQLQQMQEEISQLRGMVEEQQNAIRQMKQESLERYQDLDGRLSNSSATNSTGSSSNEGAGSNAAAQSSQASASTEPGDPEKEKLYYDVAFELVKAKDFEKADQAFNAFLRKYPNSSYAGNAQYWLGEVSLVQGDMQGALQAFSRVSERYPNHTKVPDALYKQADVEQRLGHADRAQTLLRQIVAQYPSSSAAQLAQRQLQR